ncbi:c2H2-type domain-containing protein, partial [Trichonephila clavata]
MLSRENISRIHLTTRQDIKNIKRSFGLTNQRHADDATSVKLMLEEMAELGAGNPILGCKFQGCLSSEYEGLNNEDFFLAIQHPLQKEMLKKFGKEIVCVDSTHGTNTHSYNFKLITVLVVDDFGEGFPVAWCISNREDFTALRKFFLLIKNNTETSITFNFFMSDDAPAFYNSWSDVFDFPEGKKISSHLTKPSFEEMNNIREALLDDDDVTIPEFNHQAYRLQSQVNEEVNDLN